MRYEIEAGTDAGSLLLFDPAALPADFERQFQSDAGETLERMTRWGRAFWINTEGDGRYMLHAYVDEPIPAGLEASVRDPETVLAFQVPSGQLFLTGSEYAFRQHPSRLAKHPHMGSSVAIRPGIYQLTVYRAAYPDRLVQERFRNSVSPWEYRLWTSMTVLIPLAIAAWIVLVVIYFTTARVPYHRHLSAVLALIFAVPFVVRWSDAYRSLKQRFALLEREFPSLVAWLMYRGPIERLSETRRAAGEIRGLE
ncbi:MAG: hypothetical protein ACP5XB_03445 [Isosphaeraceae bacterium]